MKMSALLASAALSAVLIAGCSQEAPQQPAPPAAEAPQTPPPIVVEDLASFVNKAAQSDMYEIQAARIAIQRSPTAAIKDFARTMVTDHTASSAQLASALSGQSGAPTPPTTLDQEHADMIQRLRNAPAAEFDQIYVDQQVEAHEDALGLLQRYGAGGDNEAVRMFAAETAPKVQHHLDMVRGLDQSGADEPPR